MKNKRFFMILLIFLVNVLATQSALEDIKSSIGEYVEFGNAIKTGMTDIKNNPDISSSIEEFENPSIVVRLDNKAINEQKIVINKIKKENEIRKKIIEEMKKGKSLEEAKRAVLKSEGLTEEEMKKILAGKSPTSILVKNSTTIFIIVLITISLIFLVYIAAHKIKSENIKHFLKKLTEIKSIFNIEKRIAKKIEKFYDERNPKNRIKIMRIHDEEKNSLKNKLYSEKGLIKIEDLAAIYMLDENIIKNWAYDLREELEPSNKELSKVLSEYIKLIEKFDKFEANKIKEKIDENIEIINSKKSEIDLRSEGSFKFDEKGYIKIENGLSEKIRKEVEILSSLAEITAEEKLIIKDEFNAMQTIKKLLIEFSKIIVIENNLVKKEEEILGLLGTKKVKGKDLPEVIETLMNSANALSEIFKKEIEIKNELRKVMDAEKEILDKINNKEEALRSGEYQLYKLRDEQLIKKVAYKRAKNPLELYRVEDDEVKVYKRINCIAQLYEYLINRMLGYVDEFNLWWMLLDKNENGSCDLSDWIRSDCKDELLAKIIDNIVKESNLIKNSTPYSEKVKEKIKNKERISKNDLPDFNDKAIIRMLNEIRKKIIEAIKERYPEIENSKLL